MEGPVTALSDLASEVRKNEYGYPEQPRKSRLPEGVIAGGAALGAAGAMGVNNAVQLPKRTADSIKVYQDRFAQSKPKAREAKAVFESKSRLNPTRRAAEAKFKRAQASALQDVKNLRANKHIARNMTSHRVRGGVTGGLMLAGGAGLAALGSKMRRQRDAYESA